MKAIIVENDSHSLNIFDKAEEFLPNLQIIGRFTALDKCSKFISANQLDVMFIDIDIWPRNWKQIIAELRNIDKSIPLVAITTRVDVFEDCYKYHVVSVLKKPIKVNHIDETLDFLNCLRSIQDDRKVEIKTFGSFAVLVNDRPIKFSRSKSKEILAYLIDKQGTTVSRKTLAAEVMNEDNYDERVINNLNTYIHWLKKDLKKVGILRILYNSNGVLAVVPSEFSCDLYQAMAGDKEILKQYRGEYLYEYSWAEYKTGYLDQLIGKE